MRTRSVDKLPATFFGLTMLNCVLWLSYGVIMYNLTVVSVNVLGFVSFATYLYIALSGSTSLSAFVFKYILTSIVLCIVCSLFLSSALVGLLALLFNVLMFVSPLQQLMKVVQTRDTSTLSPPLILMTIANCILWCIFGELIEDRFVFFPNLLGLFVGALQLLVLCWANPVMFSSFLTSLGFASPAPRIIAPTKPASV
eukprot:GILI01011170.1.p1 GENE.GILI01011170.1~~GILI01011170.1.p1  ORF type:complete len:209 (+),score=52.17 GILI01011170.1:35-628(+)